MELIKPIPRDILNADARIFLNLKKYDSVTPYLMKLHWLPVKQRIIYKLNLIVFKAFKRDTTDYIQSLLSTNQIARQLHSSDKMYNLKKIDGNGKARDVERRFTSVRLKLWLLLTLNFSIY